MGITSHLIPHAEKVKRGELIERLNFACIAQLWTDDKAEQRRLEAVLMPAMVGKGCPMEKHTLTKDGWDGVTAEGLAEYLSNNNDWPPDDSHLYRWLKCWGYEPTTRADSKNEQAEAPAVQVVSQSNEGKKRTRKINLVRAIESAVSILHTSLGKKPSIDELWNYFENDCDTTGFVEDYTDSHLTWRDTKGNIKDSPKSTVANHLSRIKV